MEHELGEGLCCSGENAGKGLEAAHSGRMGSGDQWENIAMQHGNQRIAAR